MACFFLLQILKLAVETATWSLLTVLLNFKIQMFDNIHKLYLINFFYLKFVLIFTQIVYILKVVRLVDFSQMCQYQQ